MSDSTAPSSRAITVTVLVAALGYFVDIYDLLLFSIVRTESSARPRRLGLGEPHRGPLAAELADVGLLLGGLPGASSATSGGG
jgi:putative MFS transporter